MLDGHDADSRTGRNRIGTASNLPIIHITGLALARLVVDQEHERAVCRDPRGLTLSIYFHTCQGVPRPSNVSSHLPHLPRLPRQPWGLPWEQPTCLWQVEKEIKLQNRHGSEARRAGR
jgi:hypothetical protein